LLVASSRAVLVGYSLQELDGGKYCEYVGAVFFTAEPWQGYNMFQTIAEKFNPLSWMHHRHRRQTDDRQNCDTNVVKSCQLYFGFSLPSEEWVKRAKNLDAKYIACERAFVYYGSSMFH